jgi:crotonobetainyl-CoA:carnitine CoA-transferase CaiB-like acyl-CoA transferase
LTPGEVLADRHNIERGSFASVEHPKAGPIRQPGSPFRMHATPWETKPAPVLGQHTEQVVARSRSVAPTSARTPRPRPARGRPLQGFRVVDFTTAVAGPLASSILGSLGAEVIKVESPYGRPLRPVGTAPAREGADERAYNRMTFFNAMNHGKRGISLDVSRPEGRDLFLRLAAASDVVLQNFSPRVSRNLGIEYEDLKRVRQDIVLVSMPAFGLTGPYRDRGSYGPGIDAMSGLSHLTGYADGPPLKPGNFYCDQNAGVHASFATMAALWHRRITGQGQHVELPMLEGEFQMLGDAYIDFDMNGRDRSRSGNDHPWMAPHNVFRCAGDDSWVAIAVENDSQWRALCDAIGRPSLARSESYAGAKARHRNRRELDAIVDAWTANQGHLAVQDALQQRGIPAAAVLNAGQLLVNEHVVARHGFEYVDVPGVGPTPYPRPAFVLDPPTPIEQAAPQFAEANDYVYGDLLRLTPDELSRLEASAVISREPLRR